MQSSWWRKRWPKGSTPSARGRRATTSPWTRYRPRVEPLEDRYLLAGGFKASPGFAKGGSPQGITAGRDANLYFTQYLTGSAIGRLTPGGATTTFTPPSGNSLYDVAAGADHNVWFTGSGGKIWRMTPQGQFTSFNVTDGTAQAGALERIAAGPDGNLWFGLYGPLGGDKIGRITPAGQVTQFNLPGNLMVPGSTAAGFGGITAGPDGNVWFTVYGNLARITPAGDVTAFTLPAGNLAASITAGPDGNVWFTYLGPNSNGIGTITPVGAVTEFALSGIDPWLTGLTAGPDGNVWFTGMGNFPSYAGHLIGEITPGGAVTEYTVPSNNSRPIGITTGPDGTLWITDVLGNQIWQFTPGPDAGGTTLTVAGTPLTTTVTMTHADSRTRDATLPLPVPPKSATDPTTAPNLGNPSRGGPSYRMPLAIGENGLPPVIQPIFVNPPMPTTPPRVNRPAEPSTPAPALSPHVSSPAEPATPTPVQNPSTDVPVSNPLAALMTARKTHGSSEVDTPVLLGVGSLQQPVGVAPLSGLLAGDIAANSVADITRRRLAAAPSPSPPLMQQKAGGNGSSISSVGLQEIPSSEEVFRIAGLDDYFTQS